jgi:hypothetical protein
LSRGSTLGPVPREEFDDQEATTRKVLTPQFLQTLVMPAMASIRQGLKGVRPWHVVVIAVAMVGGIAVGTGLRKRKAHPPQAALVAAVAAPVVLPKVADLKPVPLEPPNPEQPRATPKTVRIEVGVEPAEAMLTLDGETAGHQLAIDAPEDEAIHVLRASAPGFLGFSQKIRFSKDAHFAIQLRPLRAPARGAAKPHLAKAMAKSQPPIIEAKPIADERPAPVPVKQVTKTPSALPEPEEPGANLGHSRRRISMPIYEKDPYAP